MKEKASQIQTQNELAPLRLVFSEYRQVHPQLSSDELLCDRPGLTTYKEQLEVSTLGQAHNPSIDCPLLIHSLVHAINHCWAPAPTPLR